MIEIYEGRIGGGKTYHAVKRIAYLLSIGLTICTDIELKWEGLAAYVLDEWGVEIQREQFVSLSGISVSEFHRVTPKGEPGSPVTVVLDEAHLTFNSRDWSKTSRELLAFLTQSRKQYTDIIFISQTKANIDKQFRELVQFVWKFKDLTKFTVPGMGITFAALIQILTFGICRGDWMVATKFDYDGTYQDRNFARRDVRVFNSYNTDALLSDFERLGVAKKVMVKKKVTQKAAVLRVLMFAIFILGAGGYWWWKGQKKPKVEDVAKETEAPAKEKPKFRATEEVVTRDEPMAARVARATHRDAEEAQAAYDVYSESFRAYSGQGQKTLKTATASYREGSMSQRGFVVAVRDREARLLQPNGRIGWVVAEDVAGPVELPREEPQKTEQPSPAAANSATTPNSPGEVDAASVLGSILRVKK